MLELFIWGVFGGLLPEIGFIYKIYKYDEKNIPSQIKTFSYWISTILMILAGGIIVVAHLRSGNDDITPWLAINIGASAPLIIENITKSKAID